jgi:hypothetical protein
MAKPSIAVLAPRSLEDRASIPNGVRRDTGLAGCDWVAASAVQPAYSAAGTATGGSMRMARTDGTRTTLRHTAMLRTAATASVSDVPTEEEDDDRDLTGEQHDPEIGGAAELEHREGERHHRHARAEGGDRVRRQVAGEAPLAEHLERPRRSHDPSLRGGAGAHHQPARVGESLQSPR